MKMYVDFDDVISKSAQGFCALAKKMYGIDLPYESITDYNLQKSFGMEYEQYVEFMKTSQEPENLLSLEEIEGACETLNAWVDKGHEVEVVTGRPFMTYEASRLWLDRHNLSRLKLIHVDKYNREQFYNNIGNVGLEEFFTYQYDFAVEDSPAALEHLEKIENCKVAVVSRPWNQETKLKNDHFIRCSNWQEIQAEFDKMLESRASLLTTNGV